MAQLFKGDELERKFFEAGSPAFDETSQQLDLFFDGAFDAYALGEILYDSGRSPLANAIPRRIFREAFASIFNSFLVAGSFESYLTVFRTIFGDDVVVTFTVPGPGKLQIDIVAAGLQLDLFVTRYIENNAYLFDYIVDHEGDNIVFQTVKGFETQYELEQMLFEMVPDGIYTEINLTIGS